MAGAGRPGAAREAALTLGGTASEASKMRARGSTGTPAGGMAPPTLRADSSISSVGDERNMEPSMTKAVRAKM